VVALNKVDLLPEAQRLKDIKRAHRKLMQTFQMTKFADVTMVPIAAKPGAPCGPGRRGAGDARPASGWWASTCHVPCRQGG
jgi:hypothetical protein